MSPCAGLRASHRQVRRLQFEQRHGSALAPGPALAPLLPALQAYDWPGNVRELQNICERLALQFSDCKDVGDITYEQVGQDCPELFGKALVSSTGNLASDAPLSERVAEAMRLCNGNRLQAARMLNVSRSTLWRWLRDQT